MIFIRYILISLLVFSYAEADEINHLYRGEVPVTGLSAAARDAAMKLALIQVLTKVSGNFGVSSQKTLSKEIDKATAYATEYSYIKQSMGEAVNDQTLTLRVEFDHRSIDAILRKGNLKQRGASRTSALLWLVEEKGSERQLLGALSEEQMATQIVALANQHGVPVVLPSLDLQDINNISANEIWESKWPQVKKASMRYALPYIILGRLSSQKGHWHGDWQMLAAEGEAKTSHHWQTEGNSRQVVIGAAFDTAVGQLKSTPIVAKAAVTQEKTVSGISSAWFNITIEGVKTYTDYQQAKSHLKELSGVNQVETDSVASDQVAFRVESTNGFSALQTALKSNPHWKLQMQGAKQIRMRWLG